MTEKKKFNRTYKGRFAITTFEKAENDPRPNVVLSIGFGKRKPDVEGLLEEYNDQYSVRIRCWENNLSDLESCVSEHNKKSL